MAVTYVEPDGSEKEIQAEIGKNLMELAHDNNIELEGMAVVCGRLKETLQKGADQLVNCC